jgi:hypothetical protein
MKKTIILSISASALFTAAVLTAITPAPAAAAETDKTLMVPEMIKPLPKDPPKKPVKKKGKKRPPEPVSEYKFDKIEHIPTYKFDKKTNPIIKEPKTKKKAAKKAAPGKKAAPAAQPSSKTFTPPADSNAGQQEQAYGEDQQQDSQDSQDQAEE